MPLPPRYREAFRAGIVLSQGSPDRCVRAYTSEEFQRQSERITATPPLTGRSRDLRRLFFSRTQETQLDAQSRILIPAWLREYAGLSSKVLMVGAGEALEMWSPDLYERDMERIESALPTTLEAFDER